MAWRIKDSVVRGEIDNRHPGIIKGTLYLEGLKNPVTLELEGDCEPDLAGRHLIFRNLMPAITKDFQGFGELQSGEAGTITADRMVRLPVISDEELHRCLQERTPFPTRWSESLYLEWFSTNGRVVIEGASFACQLSPPKWKLTDEGYEWSRHLAGLAWHNSFDDDGRKDEEEEEEKSEARPRRNGRRDPFALSMYAVGGQEPHPLVKRVSEFLLQMISESKLHRFCRDEAVENQPLEAMLEATTRATIRLAHAMAKMTDYSTPLESEAIVRGLKQARWSLADAADHAGLANHMCSAASEWLQALIGDFRHFRREIRILILRYEESANESTSANGGSGKNPAIQKRHRTATNFVTLSDDEKLKLLQQHSCQAPFPTLDHKNWCLHCEQEFDGRSVRVWRDAAGAHWLECGTPECDGSPIDWAPFPWWDDEHPLTKSARRIEPRQPQAPDKV